MTSRLLSLKSDHDLEQERLLLEGELAGAQRWGEDEAAVRDAMRAVAREQHTRRLARVRNASFAVDPWIVDDPGIRPVISGTARTRAGRTPSPFLVAAAVIALSLLLGASLALAGQRLVELDARYAAMERV